MTKFYRVKKDTFLWQEGAILADPDCGKYIAIEDIWNNVEGTDSEYISARIIEDHANREYFERVYPDTSKGNIYKTKDQLIELYKKTFIE